MNGEHPRKKAYHDRMMRQLALEFNTLPEAFTTPGLTVTLPAKPDGVRLYSKEMPFFSMACTGNSVVVMADERLHDFIRELAGEVSDLHRLFELPAMEKINGKLKEYGYALWGTGHMCLPGRAFPEFPIAPEFTLKWFETKETLSAFYPNEKFRMALGKAYNPDRPDVIALAAMDGDRIAAVAGASADTADLWQVGIDVVEEYRGKGLGTALVAALCKRIEDMGKIPFYGTAAANVHSQIIAAKCGFYPTWVETGAYKL